MNAVKVNGDDVAYAETCEPLTDQRPAPTKANDSDCKAPQKLLPDIAKDAGLTMILEPCSNILRARMRVDVSNLPSYDPQMFDLETPVRRPDVTCNSIPCDDQRADRPTFVYA
jgi:hypothetical protein